MSKVLITKAFLEVTKAMESNRVDEANKMFRVITDSIACDKKNNTVSKYITLKNKTEENLFKNILINDENE